MITYSEESEVRDWWVEVYWNDGPLIIGDPDKLFPGLVKFDKEKLAAAQGHETIIVQARTPWDAFCEATRVYQDEKGHRVWQVHFID